MAKLSNSPNDRVVLALEQRKSFSLGLWFKDHSEHPVDLTGAVLRLSAARLPSFPGDVPPLLIEKTAVVSSPAVGFARVDLQAADLDLDPDDVPFVVTLVTSDGYSGVVVKGELSIQPNPESLSVEDEYLSADPSTSLDVQLRQHSVHVDVEHMIFAGPGVFTEGEKAKLAGIETGAEVNVNADLSAVDGDAEVLHKDEFIAQLLLLMHPVGSLYFSDQPTNPHDLFGGTWLLHAKGRAIVGVDPDDIDYDDSEIEFGAAEVTLTAEQSGLRAHTHTTPNHTHSVTVTDPGHNHTQNSHNHTQNAHTHGTDTQGGTGGVTFHGAGGATVLANAAGGGFYNGVARSLYATAAGSAAATSYDAFGLNWAHSHGVTNAIATNNAATATNNSSSTGITATVPSGGGGTTGSVAAADAANSHENRQPSITTYIWKRTA